MANWLNPVTDFINAMKSGASAGEAIARIKSDNSQAAAKLNQAAQAESDQNALGYAKLASEERQSQQSAVEKLQQAMAQQSALNAYRNRSLDEKSDAASGLLDYKNRALDTRSGLQQQGIDLKSDRYNTLSSQFQQKLAQNDAQFQSKMGLKMSDADKQAWSAAQAKQKVALKSLTDTLDNPDSASHALAAKTLADEQNVIDQISAKYGAGGSTTPPAADALTPSSNLPTQTDNTPISIGGGVTIGSPSGTGTSNTDTTSAADALTSGTSNTLPSPADSTNPYQVGRQYGNLRYKGGDPNDQNSWEAAE